MSIEVMSAVFKADLTAVKYTLPATETRPAIVGTLSATDKYVLLALADHGNSEGVSIWPSIKRLTLMCGFKSERTTQDALRHLEGAGLITVDQEATWKTTRHYRVVVPVLAAAPRWGAAGAPGAEGSRRGAVGAPPPPDGVQQAHPGGAAGAPRGCSRRTRSVL